jgi:methyl-accepting chemotaxis protein
MSASAAQVSSSVQEVAVTVFQQSASVDGLVNASVDLSSVAQNVDRMAAQFHVAAADTAEQPAPLRRAA